MNGQNAPTQNAPTQRLAQLYEQLTIARVSNKAADAAGEMLRWHRDLYGDEASLNEQLSLSVCACPCEHCGKFIQYQYLEGILEKRAKYVSAFERAQWSRTHWPGALHSLVLEVARTKRELARGTHHSYT